jgi:Replication initiator protein A
MSSRRLITASERSKLEPFVVATGDASPRDQRDLMERPFFSLAKARRTAPILYEAAGVRVEVYAVPEHGMATIWDADVLIWAASQIVEAENLGFKTSRFLRFTPYQLLTAIGRQTGARDYKLLKGALACSRPSPAPPSGAASIGGATSSPGSTSGRNARPAMAASRAWSSCSPTGSTAASSTARSSWPSTRPTSG